MGDVKEDSRQSPEATSKTATPKRSRDDHANNLPQVQSLSCKGQGREPGAIYVKRRGESVMRRSLLVNHFLIFNLLLTLNRFS
jgi:hypothetical protein